MVLEDLLDKFQFTLQIILLIEPQSIGLWLFSADFLISIRKMHESTGLLHLIFRASRQFCIRKNRSLSETVFYGAGDEARTRYLHLGKVALYRMSYTRNGHDVL